MFKVVPMVCSWLMSPPCSQAAHVVGHLCRCPGDLRRWYANMYSLLAVRTASQQTHARLAMQFAAEQKSNNKLSQPWRICHNAEAFKCKRCYFLTRSLM